MDGVIACMPDFRLDTSHDHTVARDVIGHVTMAAITGTTIQGLYSLKHAILQV